MSGVVEMEVTLGTLLFLEFCHQDNIIMGFLMIGSPLSMYEQHEGIIMISSFFKVHCTWFDV